MEYTSCCCTNPPSGVRGDDGVREDQGEEGEEEDEASAAAAGEGGNHSPPLLPPVPPLPFPHEVADPGVRGGGGNRL